MNRLTPNTYPNASDYGSINDVINIDYSNKIKEGKSISNSFSKELVLVKRDETGKIVAILVRAEGKYEIYTCAIAGADEVEELLKV